MDRILLEAASKIESSDQMPRIWELITDALMNYEVNYAIYITKTDYVPADWFVRSTLPDNWPLEETKDPNFSEPFLVHCCATFEITKMGAEFITDHSGFVDEATRAYVNKISRTGWISALGIPCRLKGSGRHGGFIIGNGQNRHNFERGVLPNADMFQSFCLIAHRRIEDLLLNQNVQRQAKPLSPRERQTLEMIANGIRPKQIAGILGVSEPSIRLYLKNAKTKLGARTKEEAVAILINEKNALIT